MNLPKNIKIVILTYDKANRMQYVNRIKAQLESIGFNNISVFCGTEIPFQDKIAAYVLKYASNNIDHDNSYYKRSNLFNCVLNHYMILKSSYNLGCEGLVVIEDDSFISDDNLNILKEYMDNIPDDYDICRLQVYNPDKYIEPYNKYFYRQLPHKNYLLFNLYSTGFDIFNRKGMKYYIDFINENGYIPADHPLINTPASIRHYIIPSDISCVRNLSSESIVPSTIQP